MPKVKVRGTAITIWREMPLVCPQRLHAEDGSRPGCGRQLSPCDVDPKAPAGVIAFACPEGHRCHVWLDEATRARVLEQLNG